MNELYPLKFQSLFKERVWGGRKLKTILQKTLPGSKIIGESWEISGVQESISVVENGILAGNNLQELIEVYMGDLVGDHIFEKFGIEFPLLFKYIDAEDYLSIQVHPDNELAAKRHNAWGKSEMWYIIQAEPGSKIITGLIPGTDREKYLDHVATKRIPEICNFEKTSSGDLFYLPAGRVHAIGPGILLAEIQQTSDITYRIYDWDRKSEKGAERELHTGLATEAIDFELKGDYRTNYNSQLNKPSSLLNTPFFNVSICDLDRPLDRDFFLTDSFIVYMCVEGSFELEYEDGSEKIHKGETILVPNTINNLQLKPLHRGKLLEISMP